MIDSVKMYKAYLSLGLSNISEFFLFLKDNYDKNLSEIELNNEAIPNDILDILKGQEIIDFNKIHSDFQYFRFKNSVDEKGLEKVILDNINRCLKDARKTQIMTYIINTIMYLNKLSYSPKNMKLARQEASEIYEKIKKDLL